MPNTLLTDDIILAEALSQFENSLGLAKYANREFENKFSTATGDTIQIRKPTEFTVRNGATAVPQDVIQRSTTLTIDKQTGVDLQLTSKELTLDLDDFSQNILQPAMVNMANQVNQDMWTTALQISNFVGTPGTPINSYSAANAATTKLVERSVPQTKLYGVYHPDDYAALANSMQNNFNGQFNSEISTDATLPKVARQMVVEDQSATRHVRGAFTGPITVNGAGQSGTTLNVSGLGSSIAGALVIGDIFTIDGVFAVNKLTRQPINKLAQFTVTADVTSDPAGDAVVPISIEDAGIILTGPYQNVSAAPADAASVNVEDTHNINLVFNPTGFTLANVSMYEPEGASFAKTIVDESLKMSLRLVKDYDILNDVEMWRFDFLYGVKAFPNYATRLIS